MTESICKKLDITVQTAQDYSVEILNPKGCDGDPDRWYEYCTRFGDVRYVTVVKDSGALCDALFDSYKCLGKLEEKVDESGLQFQDLIYTFLQCKSPSQDFINDFWDADEVTKEDIKKSPTKLTRAPTFTNSVLSAKTTLDSNSPVSITPSKDFKQLLISKKYFEDGKDIG